jgi:hypothetical protein
MEGELGKRELDVQFDWVESQYRSSFGVSHLKNFIKTQKESCTEVRKRKRVGELFLTSEQKRAFRVVQKHVSLSREERLREPLHLVVSSEAGAGKSHLLFAIATLLSSSGIPFELVGFTGTLAHQLCGKTIHGFLGLGNRCINYNLISDLPVPVFVKQNILALEYLILDEVYFLNAGLFHVLDDRLRTIFNSNSPFGGKISVIFAGDCFQTVVGTSLYKTSATLGDADQEGIKVFRAIEKVVLLKNNVRQRGDDRFLKLLKDIRFKQVDEEDLSLLQSRLHKNLSEEEKSSFDSSLHIYPYHKLVDQFNEQKVRELGVPVKKLVPIVTPENCGYKPKQYIFLAVGVKVVLTRNLDISRGLCSSAPGTIQGWAYDKNLQLVVILVKFSFYTGATLEDGNVPIPLLTDYEFVPFLNKKVKVQFWPLSVCFASTLHSNQGKTLDKVSTVLLDYEPFVGYTYTLLTRVRSLDSICFLDEEISMKRFQSKSFQRGFDDQIREFARLSLKDCLQADDNEQPPTKKVRFDLSPQLEDGRRPEPVSNLLQADANV